VGTLASLNLFGTVLRRLFVFGVPILLFTALAFFPERYRAAVTLTPAEPTSLGLSGTLGQLGAINGVFTNQAAVEVALRVSRSVQARNIVIDRLKLPQRLGLTRLQTHRWLVRKVDIRSMRGGIIVFEIENRDPRLAQDIIAAYTNATQARLAEINRAQTAYKREVLMQLVDDASRRLTTAQTVYDTFRLTNRAPTPNTAVQAISARIPQLEAAIKSKQVELASARQMFTDDNPEIRQKVAEMQALQQQLENVRATTQGESTVGQAVATSSQLFKLERDLTVARSLYDSYMRYLQGTAVEDLTSTANVRLLEPPFIDTDRQIRWPALAAAVAFLLLWGAVEFYRLRPPVGADLSDGGAHA
jgi:HPt (histidine-containing phosphotransfer) domain-containing protein